MFWYYYEFTKSYEIFKNMTKIQNYSILEILVLVIWLVFLISFVFYILPIFKIYQKKHEDEKNRRIKKQMIDRIVLQKNLEDIIARELNEKK